LDPDLVRIYVSSEDEVRVIKEKWDAVD
jgi:hypothetical protein